METSGTGGRPDEASPVNLIAKIGEKLFPVEVERAGSGYRVRIDGGWVSVDMTSPNASMRSLRFEDGTQYLIVHHREGPRHELSFGDATVHLEMHDPLAMKRRRQQDEMAGDDSVRAVMPGRVVRVLVDVGSEVTKGEGLLVIEAMKMENEIQAPRDGRVAAVHVAAGQTVEGGSDLVQIE